MARNTEDRRGELSPEVLRWAQKAKWEFLACRDVRHAWPADRESLRWTEEIHAGRRYWVRRAACMHGCGVTRVQRWDQVTGERTSPLIYPKPEDGGRSDYLLPLGCSRLGADELFRLNQLADPASAPEPKPKRARATRSGRKPAVTPTFSESSRQRVKRAG